MTKLVNLLKCTVCNTVRTHYNLRNTGEVGGKPAWAVLATLVLRALKAELITLGLLQNVMLLSSRSLLL